MTITQTQPIATPDARLRERGPIAVDLYRDIHKGIRAELFAVDAAAGSLDPADRPGWVALGGRMNALLDLLVDHAEHEDTHIHPVLTDVRPDLAAQMAEDHEAIEARFDALRDLALLVASVPVPEVRLVADRLYLQFAELTGVYLLHQDAEEWVVMPALEQAIGVPATVAINEAIVGSIPPEKMAASLAVMLPAMNVDDRAELLGGMQAGAPPEVFAGVWALAGQVLAPGDLEALGARLGV
ncbi:MAG: hemerythrin domain-containing protein [Acidimicrobiales bacterium]|jgi:hypothetical protein|nr:hemerythrin domain-containing protein [Acidimicrobiales bacterium]